MLTKRWTFKEKPDENTVKSLADTLNISETLSSLLVRRNITSFFSARSFFRPNLEELHDPFLMQGMEEASLRIIQAITANEKIYVYGDYDVDGTCSAALMYIFLKELGADAHIYIPNRIEDGYGIANSAIDLIHQAGAKLIISVDCGITAIDETDYATSLGIDVIISDHHQPGDKIPNAFAVLDPLVEGCQYPFKKLSGAGVAFKLAQAVSQRIGKNELPLKFLDFVAVAGAADIVALDGENRILVKKGLEAINEKPRPGFLALIRAAGLEPGNLTAGQIVFSIAPRINAAGRLGEAMRAIDLFLAEDEKQATYYASILESENLERRKIDEGTFSSAVDLLEKDPSYKDDLAIVLHEENWHPGVIGIVASRLVEKYYKPTIMLTTIDGVAKGSARSISGFNIYEALKRCEDSVLQFGGHEAAAGLSIEVAKIPEFKKRFNAVVKELINEEDMLPVISIDEKINFSEITPKFIRILDQFAPFGPANPRPVFYAEDIEMVYQPKIVGLKHIVICLKQKNSDKVFDAIGFNLGYFEPELSKDNNLIDIAFTIEKSVRDGKTFPQIRLKDIRIKNKNGFKEKANNEFKL